MICKRIAKTMCAAALALAFLMPTTAKADGIVESLSCLSRGIYWEALNQGWDGMTLAAYVFINQSQKLYHKTICATVATSSEGFKKHNGANGTGQYWEQVQAAAFYALNNPDKDPTHGKGIYFFSVAPLKRPGYTLEVITKIGDHVVLGEEKDQK